MIGLCRQQWLVARAVVLTGMFRDVNGQTWNNGVDGCRCITDSSWMAPFTHTDSSTGNAVLSATTSDGVYPYPPTYGLGACEQWDVLLEPSCAGSDGNPLSDAPSWCNRRWCWVDRDSCDMADVQRSSYFPDAEIYCALFTCRRLCGRAVACAKSASTLELDPPDICCSTI
eukprot:COSAG02_NODE_6062_length_3833_cov_1.835297_2_plen_171_part_00